MAAFERLLSHALRHCLSIRSYSSQKLSAPWSHRSLCSSLSSLPPDPNPTLNEENRVMRRVFRVEELKVDQQQNREGQKTLTGSLSLPHGHGKSHRVAVFDESTTADEAKAIGVDGEDLIKGIKNGFSDLINQEKSFTITSSAKMIRVAAGWQWNGLARGLYGSCSPCITPLLVHHYSTSSKSKVAYSGSEILNYMGGLDGEQKQLIHKLVNFRMKEGKKTRVRAIVHETLHCLARTDRDGVKLISDALENVKPICEVAKVRIAGNIYDVPGVVARDRQQTLAVRWILDAAFKRRTNHSSRLEECLFAEIMDAYRKRGTARKKREILHGLASSNRSYAHFRWW